MKARLQLTNPIQAGGPDEGRTLLEVLLEAALVERGVAKRAELRWQSPQRPDETELSHRNINDQREARFLRGFECSLRFALLLCDWICAGEQSLDEVAVRIGFIRL